MLGRELFTDAAPTAPGASRLWKQGCYKTRWNQRVVVVGVVASVIGFAAGQLHAFYTSPELSPVPGFYVPSLEAEETLALHSNGQFSFTPQLAKVAGDSRDPLLEAILTDTDQVEALAKLRLRFDAITGQRPWAPNVYALVKSSSWLGNLTAALPQEALTSPVYSVGLMLGDPLEIKQDRRAVASRLMNRLDQFVGQLECYSLPKAPAAYAINRQTDSGAWCNKHHPLNHVVDAPLRDFLCPFFRGYSVASFGEGHGYYVRHVQKHCPESVTMVGYDGGAFAEYFTNGSVQFMDLTMKQEGIPLYDWVLSLEVAEHIPREFENVYLDNVLEHARVGVVVSWARPLQGGHGHVNEKVPEVVEQMFLDRGFMKDLEATTLLKDHTSLSWLKANTNVYKRVHPLTNASLVAGNYWGGASVVESITVA